MRFRKLLVGIDFSEAGREAFATGIAMAGETGAQLVFAHVVQAYPYVVRAPGLPVGNEAAILDDVKQDLEALEREAKEAGAKRVSSEILTGVPWYQLVQLLQKDPTFDLAIVGTHGHTGIKHVLLGSVAEKIVRHAPCPVLVVRARE